MDRDTRIGPIEHSQMDPTEGSRCTKHTDVYWLAVFVHIGKLGQWSKCTLFNAVTLRQQNGEDEEETQRKQEAQGNWDEEATEKRWKKPNATQERG